MHRRTGDIENPNLILHHIIHKYPTCLIKPCLFCNNKQLHMDTSCSEISGNGKCLTLNFSPEYIILDVAKYIMCVCVLSCCDYKLF